MVQWLGLYVFTAKSMGSIPAWEIKILQAVGCDPEKKKEREKKYVIYTIDKETRPVALDVKK